MPLLMIRSASFPDFSRSSRLAVLVGDIVEGGAQDVSEKNVDEEILF